MELGTLVAGIGRKIVSRRRVERRAHPTSKLIAMLSASRCRPGPDTGSATRSLERQGRCKLLQMLAHPVIEPRIPRY